MSHSTVFHTYTCAYVPQGDPGTIVYTIITGYDPRHGSHRVSLYPSGIQLQIVEFAESGQALTALPKALSTTHSLLWLRKGMT